MFRLEKRKIFLLYQYYLIGNIPNFTSENEKDEKRLIWFSDCLKKGKNLSEKIDKKLKIGWDFSRLPHLEKSILIYATYELFSEQNSQYIKSIISQIINFSKVYLETSKYAYINKVLDLLVKEETTLLKKEV